MISEASPSTALPTAFAPAERATPAALRQAIELFADAAPYPMLNAMPNVFLILNEQRQIVYGNRAVLDMVRTRAVTDTYGQRPGEALQCRHAHAMPGGCGTSEACSTCGAVLAILTSRQQNAEETRECRILRADGDALDLRVRATPLAITDGHFTMFAVQDISHEKRRRALERIFFHDILNTAGGMMGLASILREVPADELDELVGDLQELAGSLVVDIKAQQTLAEAENGDLMPEWQPLDSLAVLRDVVAGYHAHPVAAGRALQTEAGSDAVELVTDVALLRRVMGNMVKNALEASAVGQTVTVACRRAEDGVTFTVHNVTVMPRDVQLQVFQRSFTTKGRGRGLGTYSMRLLAERYLSGRVSFVSTPETGTIFTAWIPFEPPALPTET
jgi:signal transduction histidine kinase